MSDEFYICICSPFGPTYQFHLLNHTVHYGFSTQHLVRPVEQLAALEYQPNKDAIEGFWTTVFEIGVPDWDPEYIHPEITDGPGWKLLLRRNKIETKSEGRAAFPNSPHPAYSPEFIDLIVAVRKLLNWMPFG
ncbi:MAG: hypothetical protein ACOCVC_07025 [Spirochaeta sp.]